MAQTKFKYKIDYYYNAEPRSRNVLKELVDAGIPERTFYRDRAITLKQRADIPSERLRKYAVLFCVEVTELYNSPSPKPAFRKEKINSGLK